MSSPRIVGRRDEQLDQPTTLPRSRPSGSQVYFMESVGTTRAQHESPGHPAPYWRPDR